MEKLASPAARAAEEGLPADHRFGDRRVRHQAVPHARRESGRAQERTSSSPTTKRSTAALWARSRPAAFRRSRSGSSISIRASCRCLSRMASAPLTVRSRASSGRCGEQGVEPRNVAGVILETYQGGSAAFAPPEYMQRAAAVVHGPQGPAGLRRSAGGLRPHRNACGASSTTASCPIWHCFGKGISSSLPLSAVTGRPDVMDLHPPGSMTSTHTGNPICCAAALASIDLVLKEKLAENARKMGAILHEKLRALKAQIAADRLGGWQGSGRRPGLRDPGHQGAGCRPGVGGGATLRRKGRADVQPGGLWRRAR